MKLALIKRRIKVAELEHLGLLALRGSKSKKHINRMDTVRKHIWRLRAKLEAA